MLHLCSEQNHKWNEFQIWDSAGVSGSLSFDLVNARNQVDSGQHTKRSYIKRLYRNQGRIDRCRSVHIEHRVINNVDKDTLIIVNTVSTNLNYSRHWTGLVAIGMPEQTCGIQNCFSGITFLGIHWNIKCRGFMSKIASRTECSNIRTMFLY